MANSNNSKILGVNVAAITEILGVGTDKIVSVGKVPVSSLTGWPVTTTTTTAAPTTTTTTQGGISCNPVTYGFDPMDPNGACRAPQEIYSQAVGTNFLYLFNRCGSMFAPTGFYSDGRNIYRWDMGLGDWSFSGPCAGF